MSSNVQIDTSSSSTSNQQTQQQQNQQQQQQQTQQSSQNGTPNSSNNQVNNRSNLIVNYLPQSVKEHDFNLLFSKIGPLKSCKLMFDRTTGYSFGYGFVEYVNEEDAKKAIDTLNGYQIEHKRLKVALARPNCEETKNTNLYIRNIPISYDEQQLHELFSQYGEVIQVRLLRDQNTAFSRRIGFVIMATKQMAQIAIQNLDNTIPPNGSNEPIYVKYADEDGSKKKHPPGMGGGHSGGRNHFNNHNNHHHNHNNHHHHQNNYHQNSYHHQAQNFNSNSFIMQQQQQQQQQTNQQQQQQSTQNQLNLGKMKTNRSNGHQNRYNPIGGQAVGQTVNGANPTNGAINTGNQGPNGNNYNPWNLGMAAALQQQQQQGYSNFGTPNALLGNSGFDNLINTIGGGTPGPNGSSSNNSGYAHHPNIHHAHQMQQHGSNNNYLNLNAAAAMAAAAAAAAAAAGLGNSSSSGNLLDVSGPGGIAMDTSKSGLSYNSAGASNTIYVYGIGSHASESDLYSLFSNCGRISRVNVIKNPKTGQSKGFGFVVFESFEEANLAVHTMNGYVYHNRPLQVQLHLDS